MKNKKNNNSGKVSIFLCLLISGMVILVGTFYQIINIYNAKSKSAMSARGTISSAKAQYNNYIFEKYHILLLDKNCGGKGEAFLEQIMEKQLQKNLGNQFIVSSVSLNEGTFIGDNKAEGLKNQIDEYMSYVVVDYSIDKILTATNGKDGELDKEVLDSLDNFESEEQIENNAENVKYNENDEKKENNEKIENDKNDKNNETATVIEDPRDFLKRVTRTGFLMFVKPAKMDISAETVDISEVPSRDFTVTFGESEEDINYDFDSIYFLKKLLTTNDKWVDNLKSAGTEIVYARNVFNCATNQNVNEDTVFKCEMEYLIGGRKSDYDNMEYVVSQLILIRFPIDFVYLLNDSQKQEEIEVVSIAIAAATGIPPELTEVLITGAWSFAEAMADVKMLLKGKRMSFVKNKDNWITDLQNIEESLDSECDEDLLGLCYEDYLMILMSMHATKLHYRMLDIMQLNACQYEENFRIKNSLVAIDASYEIDYKNKTFFVREEDGY